MRFRARTGAFRAFRDKKNGRMFPSSRFPLFAGLGCELFLPRRLQGRGSGSRSADCRPKLNPVSRSPPVAGPKFRFPSTQCRAGAESRLPLPTGCRTEVPIPLHPIQGRSRIPSPAPRRLQDRSSDPPPSRCRAGVVNLTPPPAGITCGRSSCNRRSPRLRAPPRYGAAGCTWPYGPNATSNRS